MKKYMIGVAIGVCLPILLAYAFIRLGGMPVATKGRALPFEKSIANMAIHAAMDKYVGVAAPLTASPANLIAGAHVYELQCAVCHGQLDQRESGIARGMFPHPPQLLPPHKGVTDDPVGKIYWKVKNGIRLTGMPDRGRTV